MIRIFSVLLTGILLIGCQKQKTKNYSVITEVYEVDEGADDRYAKGKLKYMEQENYSDGKILNKTIYNEDQSIRGKEVYVYEKNQYPTASKYYDGNGAVLSSYQFEYDDSLRIKSMAYEGENGDLLRIERFQYDPKGNMVKKTIYNDLDVKQRSFIFGHDNYGNEVQMVLLDENDEQILSESYEIVTKTKKGEWIEKWGYLNDAVAPVTFYHKKKSNKE